jgi:hypothetical protein
MIGDDVSTDSDDSGNEEGGPHAMPVHVLWRRGRTMIHGHGSCVCSVFMCLGLLTPFV